MDKNHKTAYSAALIVAIIWGAAFPIVKPALDYISAQQFLLLRYAVAALTMLPIIIRSILNHTFPLRHQLKTVVSLESLSMAVLLIMYSGLERAPAIQASFIITTKPILVTLAGVLFLKEIEEKKELAGLVLSVVGTAMVISAPLFFGSVIGTQSKIELETGNLLVLIAVLIEVIYVLKIKTAYRGFDKKTIAAISSLIGLIIFGGLNSSMGTLPTIEQVSHWQVILAALYMGGLGTGLAFALSLKAYSLIEASEVVLFEYLNPLIYIPLSVWWLREQVLPLQVIGIILIAVGVFIAEVRKPKLASPLKLNPS